MDKFADIEAWSESAKPEKAWKLCIEVLTENPNDPRGLVAACFMARRLGLLPAAYHFGRSMTQMYPEEPTGWINFGEACREMWLVEEAEKSYQIALKKSHTKGNQLASMLNLAALYVDNGFFTKAEAITNELLKIDPNYQKARINLGFCKLARRDWSGWKAWHGILGTHQRPKVQYKEEPEWDGSPGKTVVLYAEQGIGDEISFASMIPDAERICKKVIFDCDGRLAGLFQRSFPNVKVYGTRIKQERWAKEDWDMDASLAVGQVGEFFRLKDSDFPGTPYLVPCPHRTGMWREKFKGKPTVGIAWTGGMPRTNARNRRLSLKQLLQILELPARFVSLQYKDSTKEIEDFRDEFPDIDLNEFPWATETFDYDDTAALIAACDFVVCMQTAVAHTAGGLGVPVAVLVPKATSWRYGLEGDSIPWYKSLRVIRQVKDGDWAREIRTAREWLESHLRKLSEGAGETPQLRGLRSDGREVRGNGQYDHRPDGGEPSP